MYLRFLLFILVIAIPLAIAVAFWASISAYLLGFVVKLKNLLKYLFIAVLGVGAYHTIKKYLR